MLYALAPNLLYHTLIAIIHPYRTLIAGGQDRAVGPRKTK